MYGRFDDRQYVRDFARTLPRVYRPNSIVAPDNVLSRFNILRSTPCMHIMLPKIGLITAQDVCMHANISHSGDGVRRRINMSVYMPMFLYQVYMSIEVVEDGIRVKKSNTTGHGEYEWKDIWVDGWRVYGWGRRKEGIDLEKEENSEREGEGRRRLGPGE